MTLLSRSSHYLAERVTARLASVCELWMERVYAQRSNNTIEEAWVLCYEQWKQADSSPAV